MGLEKFVLVGNLYFTRKVILEGTHWVLGILISSVTYFKGLYCL